MNPFLNCSCPVYLRGTLHSHYPLHSSFVSNALPVRPVISLVPPLELWDMACSHLVFSHCRHFGTDLIHNITEPWLLCCLGRGLEQSKVKIIFITGWSCSRVKCYRDSCSTLLCVANIFTSLQNVFDILHFKKQLVGFWLEGCRLKPRILVSGVSTRTPPPPGLTG